MKAHKKSLYAKYGKAYLLRQRLWGYQRMLEVLEQCFQDREALTQRKRQLAAEAKPGISEVREQERIKIKINWLDRKSVYLTKMGDILRQLKAAGSVREGGWSE